MDELNLPNRQAFRMITVVIGVAALYWASEFLIPLALAVLVSFLLYPAVAWLRRLRLPNGIAVALVTLAAIGILGGVGYVVSHQAVDLTAKLPDYRLNLKAKIRGFQFKGGTVAKLNGTIRELKEEFASSQSSTASAQAKSGVDPAEPIPVQVVSSGLDLVAMASSFATPLVAPIATLVVSIVFLVFILLGAEELRDRIVWFAGAQRISVTTSVIEEIGQSISQFLRMQLMVNTIYGVAIALLLLLIGVPNAMFFGLIAGLLRYVPYIGPWIAAALPTLLSIAIFEGWSRPLVVVAAFVACEICSNLLLEPWLYSASTGISSWGIVLSSFFWGWLWGPVGLIVGMPMTVCLVVIGRRVRTLSFFTELLGSGDVLSPEGKLYQRLLAWDESGASEIINGAVQKSDAMVIADSLLAPVLERLKQELQNGGITLAQAQFAARAIEDAPGSTEYDADSGPPMLLCLAAQSEMDDTAARLLARLAQGAGYHATVASSATLASEALDMVKQLRPLIVAIVQVRPFSLAHSTYLIKLIRKQTDASRIVAVCFDREATSETIRLRFTQNGAETVLTSFSDSLRYLAERAPLTPEIAKPAA